MAKNSDKKVWFNPDQTTHTLLLTLMIVISVLFYGSISAAGVLILGSFLASTLILLHKYRHHLTTVGTITFSYFIAGFLAIGIVSVLRALNTPFESVALITVFLLGLSLFWLDLFHPPALSFGTAYVVFPLGLAEYLLAICGIIFCFVLIRAVMYMLHEHLSLNHFIHELIKEEEELILKEERKILKKKVLKKKKSIKKKKR